MKRILMVCLGNICRSPMAQGILEHKIKELNLGFIVDSAGTSSYHIGESPDGRAIEKCSQMNIDISQYRGRQFVVSDFDEFDHIYVMDTSNLRDVLSLARFENDKNKTDLIMNKVYAAQNMSVPDPYYGGIEGFDNVFQLLDRACDKILEELIYES